MKINRQEIKSNAKESLKGNWGTMILSLVIVLVVSMVISGTFTIYNKDNENIGLSFLSMSLSLIWSSMIVFGMTRLNLNVSRNEKAEISTLFSGINLTFKALGATLFIMVFTYLWMLLLIIPGIIAVFRYALTMYILTDNPDMGIREAVNESKRLMKGRKWEFFVLGLSFLGWAILCTIPCGLGYLWLGPYMNVTTCNFYNKILEQDNQNNAAAQTVVM